MRRRKVSLMKKMTKLAILSLFLIAILVQGVPVNANSPQSMTIDYDFSSQVLSIDIAHSVSDVSSHYIYEIEVSKNSVGILTKTYATQNTTAGMSVTYSIPAVHGNVLSATAKCIQSGEITNQVTVVDPDNTDTTPTNGGETWMEITLFIGIAIVAIGVVAMIFALLRRR
jgi:hypothetical protein